MDNRQTEKSMPDKWVDYIKKHIYKGFWAELRPLINKTDDINGNSKMAEIVLSLARKNGHQRHFENAVKLRYPDKPVCTWKWRLMLTGFMLTR